MRSIFYHSIEASLVDDGTVEVLREINDDIRILRFDNVNSFLEFLEQYYTQCAIDFNSPDGLVVLQ
jgi:predicted translin family RNA/ssDNA-binding protein